MPPLRSRLVAALVPAAVAVLAPAPAGATIYLPPVRASAMVDGVVNPSEYFNGLKLPLQDFTTGGANGDLYLMVNNERLFIGMHVASTGLVVGGRLEIFLDARRPETLNGIPGANQPRPDDRRLTLSYGTDPRNPSATVIQKLGWVGVWITVPPADQWQTEVASAPAGAGFVDIELSIRLHPDSSEIGPLADGEMGLGIVNHGADGSVEHLPNGVGAEPDPSWPLTWETVLFELPPRVDLDLTMFNVGQMPFFDIPAGDGGDGEPEDVAKTIYDKEVVCLSEMWSNDDIDDLLTELHKLRDSEGMKDFEVVGVESDYHDVANLWDGDGIMLLSARPIIATDEIVYDECNGVDCLSDKGAIWARVLIAGGEPTTETAGNADHFVDVFCTHLNNNDTDTSMTVSDPKAARQAQLEQLHEFVVAKAAPDRPAFVLGDLNVKAESSEYPFLIVTMGLLPTPFDVLNFQLVDEKDLGLLANPVQGTFMGSDCTVDEVDKLPSLGRFDYVLAVSGTQEWPDWAIAAADTQVDPVFLSLGAYDASCLSDHAMVTSHVELIHSTVPPKWNPLKDHKVTFTVTKLVDHASGGCCADWYTPVLWLNPESKAVSDDDTADGDTVYPGDTWNISAALTDHDVSSMNVEVWDWDAGNDDHYDMTDSGLDPVYEIDHWFGDWNRLDENWNYDDTVGNFNDFPDGIYIETHGTSSADDYGDAGLSLTAVELP